MSTGDPGESVSVLNMWAVTGLAVAGVLGFGALFMLPALRDSGISILVGFAVIGGLEGIAALIAAVSVLRLHTEKG
ncbi:MAG: hypothetical protein ABEH56_02440 [Salinirussus sp.]